MRARVERVRGIAGAGECRRRCGAPQTEVCLRLVACIGSISAVELVLAPRVTGLIVGLSASPRAPHPAGCHSAGVGNARRGPFVVGTVRAGLGDSQPWVGTGTLLTHAPAGVPAGAFESADAPPASYPWQQERGFS